MNWSILIGWLVGCIVGLILGYGILKLVDKIGDYRRAKRLRNIKPYSISKKEIDALMAKRKHPSE